jgi:hypothetical protein
MTDAPCANEHHEPKFPRNIEAGQYLHACPGCGRQTLWEVTCNGGCIFSTGENKTPIDLPANERLFRVRGS